MYIIKADGKLLYSPELIDDAYKVIAPKMHLEINAAGSLDFTLPPCNALYDEVLKMKSIITVEQDGEVVFRGRITEESVDTYKQRRIYCEGDLAFLLDSLQGPVEFTGTQHDLFNQLIAAHNAQMDADKQFTLGDVSGLDREEVFSISELMHTDTLSMVQTYLLDVSGGYIQTRTVGDVHYIDYVDGFTDECSQVIEFGVNMLNFESQMNAQEVCTVFIPLGAMQDDGTVLTIASVNGDKEYIENPEAIAQYGRICKSYTWENVTDPEELLRLGNEYLQGSMLPETLMVTAIDMHLLDADVEKIRKGCMVRLLSKPHGLDKKIVCASIDADLENGDQTVFGFGLPNQRMQTLAELAASAAADAEKAKKEAGHTHRWLKETETSLNVAIEHLDLIGHRVNQVEIDVDAAEAAITLKASQHEVDVLGERMSAAEIRIDGAEAAISLKAAQSVVDDLSQRLSGAEIRIDGAEAAISLKAAQSTVDALGERLTTAEIEIDGANAQIALKASKSEMDSVSERLTNAEVTIDGLNAEIKLVATQKTIDELVERLSAAEVVIDGLNAEIKMVATQKTIDELVERLSQAEILIDGANAAIELKASKSDVSTMERRLSQAEIDIDGANAAIALKASQADFDGLDARISQAEVDIDGANAAINLKASKTSVENLTTRVSQAEIDINGAEAAINLKAEQSTVTALSQRLSSAEVEIDGLDAKIKLFATESSIEDLANRVTEAELLIDGANAAIELKASKSDVTAMEKRLSQAEIDIDGANAAIALKAAQSTVTALSQRLSVAEVDIDAAEAAIKLKASKSDVDDMEDRLSQAEVDIDGANAAINLKASQSTVTALGNRVSQAEIKINGATSSIELLAEEIRLAGYVTMEDFETVQGWATDFSSTSISGSYIIGGYGDFDDLWVGQLNGGSVVSDKHSHKVTVNSDGTITLGEVSSTGGSFKIADTAYYKNGVSAAKNSVTLTSKGWQGGSNVVEASNGKSVTVSLPTFSVTGGDTFTNNKTTVYFSTSGVNGYLKSKEVDATSVYNSGNTAGKNAVTLSAAGWQGSNNVVSASNGKSVTVSLPTFSVSGGTSWSNNKTTVYFSTASVSGALKSKEVDATSVYNSGYTAGSTAGKNAVTLSAAGWQGSSNVVSASNGKSVTVSLPTFSVSGGTSWSNNKTTVYFSTPSVSGSLQSKTVDATSVYNNGYSAGAASVDTTSYYNSGWNACRDACSLETVYTISENSPGTLYIKVGDYYSSVGSSWVKVTRKYGCYTIPSAKS